MSRRVQLRLRERYWHSDLYEVRYPLYPGFSAVYCVVTMPRGPVTHLSSIRDFYDFETAVIDFGKL